MHSFQKVINIRDQKRFKYFIYVTFKKLAPKAKEKGRVRKTEYPSEVRKKVILRG